jgi:repressor LexA
MMARRKSKVLSERQKKILLVIEDFQEKLGYPPSIREICEKAKISSTSVVNYYLEQLEELGYIERDGRVSRGIRLLKTVSETGSPVAATTSTARAAAASIQNTANAIRQTMGEMFQVPIIGRIFASTPVPMPQSDFSYYDAESMVNVASSLLSNRDRSGDLFALEVQGDSMIDAMIYDGDIVIMKPAQEARNGEMVAVWLTDRDETTLKYFYNENGRVRLQPANPTMQPIFIDNPSSVQVQGKVVMVIRQMKGMVA